ncbi:MAG: putative rane protein [Lachnospiraceae bacterium]|jgi:hypothetical protein|nr:putative rane protein [Lachnospiraceae bacterium]
MPALLAAPDATMCQGTFFVLENKYIIGGIGKMNQLNSELPELKEENHPAEGNSTVNKPNSPLLNKVRQNYGVFGGLSLLFGGVFAFCFYEAGIGLNMFLFAFFTVLVILVAMKQLSIPIKNLTWAYLIGALLLGLSSMLTANGAILFLNTVGMLILLELALLHQLFDDKQWDFYQHFSYMFLAVISSIASLNLPLKDFFEYMKKTRLFQHDKIRSVFIGIVIAVPLLWMIIGLLSSADLLFSELTDSIYTFIFSSDIIWILLMIIIGYAACYLLLCGFTARAGLTEKSGQVKKADSSIAITVLSLLCFVYLIFCGIQIFYLFAHGLFILPKEFTFAEYARRGFFELLWVTVINIILMIISTTWFQESKVTRFLLTCITVSTYVMIGSAVYRMLLYIGAYNLTFLRLIVLLFLAIDSFVLAGVILSVYKKGFPLFQYCIAVTSVFYLIFSFGKPDYLIASYYARQNQEMKIEDVLYLTEDLSLDAVSVVLPYLEQITTYQETTIDNMNERNDQDRYNQESYSKDSIDITDDWFDTIKADYYERIHMAYRKCDTGNEFRNFNLSNYLAEKKTLGTRDVR